MTITVNFDPPLPSDNPATFNSKAFALLGNLNTWSGQANALAVEVNQDEAALAAAVSSAQTSASTATTQAGIATTQAGIATTQASNALNSANAAAASLDAFDDRYLGSKSVEPTVDNDGNVLLSGALYWNSSTNTMRVYNGSTWQDVAQGVSTPFQTFSGTGSQTAFTLSGTPGAVGAVEVFISGVRQVPTTNYTVSGTTLTFVTAPPAGTNNVFVRWISTQPMVNGALTGDLTLTGTALRIRGDFSNATVANRVMFQTSTTNSSTVVGVLPNGTGNYSEYRVFNAGDPTNASTLDFSVGTSVARIRSDITGTGTYLPMIFATGGSERMRIDTSGSALVNLSTPRAFANGVVTPLFQVASAGPGAGIGATRFSSTVDSHSRLVLARSGSDTLGTDAVVPSNATLGSVEFQGHDGTAYQVRAFVRGVVEGSVSASNLPTAIIFFTGSTGASERLRIDSTGNVLVTNNTGGLGYGTGAGGTVTQGSGSGKATTVTLNRPTGQITMNSATLNAGAVVTFQLNNSLIANTDQLIATLSDDFSPANYSIRCSVGTGRGRISLTNISAGNLTEAVVLNFAIIKGATS